MNTEEFEKQISFFEENKEYTDFVDKFKPKKTTDDCYTPENVFDAIKTWACKKYGIDPEKIVRPFFPGGDYERYTYEPGCVVLDNPPFSIISRICEFYLDRGINFFLFAPSLTVLSGRKTVMRMTHIITDSSIIYENGAVVKTAFVTNLAGEIILQTAPDLHEVIENAQKTEKAKIPKYEYPHNVITAAHAQKYAERGIEFVVKANECLPIYAMDVQKESGKTIFGSGLLLSDRLAADRLAADRLAKKETTVWELTKREKDIIEWLNREKSDGEQLPKSADTEAGQAEDQDV